MNKVIRTARISSQPVVLPIHVDRDSVELPFEPSEEATFSEEDFEAAQAQDVAESFEFTSLVDQAEVIEEEPGLTEEEVEAIVAERLAEAEARFLQEKEQEKEAAHQAGMEAGQAQGYAEGHAAGLAEGQAQSQDEIARFQAMTNKIAERWDRVFKGADMDLTQLALAVAKNVVGSIAQAQEDLVLASVQDCLALVQDVKQLTICVSPQDLAIVRENRTRWQEAYERIESMAIEADDSIEPGGCIVETPAGDIDGQISSRLEKLQSAILEKLQGAPAEAVPDVSDVVAEPETDLDDVAESDLVQEDAPPSDETLLEEQVESNVDEDLPDMSSQITETQDLSGEDLLPAPRVDQEEDLEMSSEDDTEALLPDSADVATEDPLPSSDIKAGIDMPLEDGVETLMPGSEDERNQVADLNEMVEEAAATMPEDVVANDSEDEAGLVGDEDVATEEENNLEVDAPQDSLDAPAEAADLGDTTEGQMDSVEMSEQEDENGVETNLETDNQEMPSAEMRGLETETEALDAESFDEDSQNLDADTMDENQTGEDGQA